MSEITPEQKRKRIETAMKVFLLLLVGFVVAPFIFIAIKGLIGLVVAGLIGIILIQFAPVVAVMVANWRLKMLKAEAARNPVESLQNDYNRRMDAITHFREAIRTFTAEVSTFEDKLGGFKQQFPNESKRFDEQLGKMKALLALRVRKYQDAQTSLEAYKIEIKKTSAIWEMSKAAATLSQAAGSTDDDFITQVMRETAIDSVQTNMNSAFADLEISLLDEDRNTAQKIYAAKYQGGEMPVLQAPNSSSLPTPKVTVEVQPLNVRELIMKGAS